MITSTDVWIKAEDELLTGKIEIVEIRQQASRMNQSHALQVEQGANRCHAEYAWKVIPAFTSDKFLVEGTKR